MNFVTTRTQICKVIQTSDPIREFVSERTGGRSVVLADKAVSARLAPMLRDSGLHERTIWLDGGEDLKSMRVYADLLFRLEALDVRRRDELVCVGGSTISDIGGFVAATYLRGIDYVNIPTTVLAQVDGSVGGKVAINSPRAKNAIGAFWHPSRVLLDVQWFSTLSRSEISCGLAESVKVACLDSSASLLDDLRKDATVLLERPTGNQMVDVVTKSIGVKLALLEPDPFETDLRRDLNLGHTIAHPLESLTNYTEISHGAAVARGVAAATRYGMLEGLTDELFGAGVLDILKRLQLPTIVDGKHVDGILGRLSDIRRVRGGCLNYVVPLSPGRTKILDSVNLSALRLAMIGEQ